MHDRYKSGEGYHVVPPPYTGTFMPCKPDLVFHDAPTASKTVPNVFNVEPSTTMPTKEMSQSIGLPPLSLKIRFLTQKMNLRVSLCLQKEPIFVQTFEHVKTPRTSVKPVKHPTQAKNLRKDTLKSRVTTVKVNKVNVVKGTKGNWGDLQQALKDKGIIDSGCSRHVTENISYLSNFEEINGGYVAFRGNSKGDKIIGKGKIKTGKLDFDDVYFVKELKFNLFSVSHMCDKKNSVLFTDTECVILSSDFKLLDENHVLLRVPRENNMYNVDLKNVVPSGDLTCLFAKATLDESNLWHKRLGHINFKTMNKLVKGNLVRGLPSKVFENNHTCVACKKGKQHRASCKTKHISSVSHPLQRCPVTILNTLDPLGKFDGKADEGFLVGYSVNSMAFRVFNSRTKIVKETLHINFLENQPNVTGSGPTLLFDIDTLTQSMNYQTVVAGNQPNHNADADAAFDVKENEFEVHVSPSGSDKTKKHDEKTKREAKGKSHVDLSTGVKNLSDEFEDFSSNSNNMVNAANAPVTAGGPNSTNSTNSFNAASASDNDVNMPALEDIVYSDDEEDVGAEADFSNLETSITINEDDIKEIDIKWNMALLSMRADRFWKKTGKKITIQGTNVAGFDKLKVECFNCHKMGHFARECRAPRSQDRGRRENFKQGSKEEEQAPKALIAIDGVGWDWSYMANEEENHALVADEEAPTEFALIAKSSLSQVEARLVEFKTHEIKFCEKIRGLEFDLKNINIKIKNLMNELEQIKKKKEGLDSKLTGFESASKDLDTLLGSQRSDKNKEGLGYSAIPPLPSCSTDSSTVIKTNKIKPVRKPSVKYAEMYRNTSKSPKFDHLAYDCGVWVNKGKTWPKNNYTHKSLFKENQQSELNFEFQGFPLLIKKFPLGNSQNIIDDKGYWDSGCSQNMTGNISYLSDYEPYDGGYVSFGQGGGKISGKGYFEYWKAGLVVVVYDHLGKFDAKGDEGYFIGYSRSSKAFRVFNKRTKRVEENLHVDFLENKLIEKGASPMESAIPTISSPVPTACLDDSSEPSTQTRNKFKEMEEQSFIATIHQKTNPALLQFCLFSCFLSQEEPKKISDALKDPSWVEAMQEEILQFKIQNVLILVDCPEGEKGIDYKEVFAPVARIEAIRLFLAYASFMGFTIYQMDAKSAFLYGTIDEEVYVMQPPGFQDPEFPDKVYKVEKAMYGLHQASRAWYALMHEKFQMSAMGELNFFLGLQILQKKDGIFLSQDKYVGDILKNFRYLDVRSANTPMDKENSWGKDRTVTPKECHLHTVKRIFKYLKGHPKLGLWYPKESPFDLVAYSDSDYGGASQDRKSTTGGSHTAKTFDLVWIWLGGDYGNLFLIGYTEIQRVGLLLIIKVQFIPLGYFPLLYQPVPTVRYALTINPTVYVSHIRQLWSTARIDTTDEGTKILTTVDGKFRTISESSIRRNLKLNDEEGISTLPDAELFENLALMGYNIFPNQNFTFQKALPTAADEPASLLGDDSQGEAFPTVSSLEAKQDRENIIKTSTLPHDSTPRVTSLAADKGNFEISSLKARIKLLEDKDGGGAEPSGEDAIIKGRSLETGEEAGVEKSTKRGSNDTEELVNVLTSMDAANILTSGVYAVSVPSVTEIPTVCIPTGSGMVPIASPIFTTASVVTPYSRRKMAREMEEQMTREDQRRNEQIARDAKKARIHAEEELHMMIDGLDRSNEMIAKHLHEYEQVAAKLTIGEKIDLINELVKYQDHHSKILKYQAQQSKPLSKKQQREFYMSVLKSHSGWKTKHFKASKEEGERFKRKGLRLEQGSAKKMKTSEEVSEEDLKEMMQLVPVEEVCVEALQVKHPGRSTQRARETIGRLSGWEDTQQQALSDKEKELWIELKMLFEPNHEDQLWTHTQALMHDPVEWKLYDTCGVHHGRIVGNKMLKSFPLPVMKFPLLEYFPTTSEEMFPLLRQRDAPAEEVCTAKKLKKVAYLEHDKVAQALEITKLKQRVRKLERKRRSNLSGLNRLKKVDDDEDVTLVDVDTAVEIDADTQERMEGDVNAVNEVNGAEPTVFDEEEVTMTMAQTLIKMKAKKARLFDEQMAKRLQDKEIEQAATREKGRKKI
uniref:Putative ribonuclease H-like domain-containing protein n=1 Tax=Tanacetum cinerariifolium TaxID=118510 RepID=A0A6L2NKR7_TANCI|nr:putative ribonuclease H-like domain-containing protein [Tanacetum cinerariifolium]